MSNILDSKQQLQFPLDWHTRLIVQAEISDTQKGIEQIFSGLGLSLLNLSAGNVSSGALYCTWQISANIPNLAVFRAVSKALSELPGAKILL
ncbi:MAG: hypothetical protein WCT05_14110 [Lentisphaeria bacterium]